MSDEMSALLHTTGMPMRGRGAMVFTADVREAELGVVNAWYTHQHVPERVSLAGFIRGTRWHGSPRRGRTPYLTIYETEDIDVFASPEYLQALDNPTTQTRASAPLLRDAMRTVMRVARSAGDAISADLVKIDLRSIGTDAALRQWFDGFLDDVLSDPSVTSASLLTADPEVTSAKSRTAEAEAFATPERIASSMALITGSPVDGDRIAALIHRSAITDIAADVEISRYRLMSLADHAGLTSDG